MSLYTKPLPRLTPDNQPFWEAARRRELRLPRCRDCGEFHFPPGPVCPFGFGDQLRWAPLSGCGTVSALVVMHRAWLTAFEDALPYAVVQVELEEGPRLTSNVVGVSNEELAVGMAVEVVFDDVTETITLPRFRPR